jgi:hypothetical protein
VVAGHQVKREELVRAWVVEQDAAGKRQRRNDELDLEPEALAERQPIDGTETKSMVRRLVGQEHERRIVGDLRFCGRLRLVETLLCGDERVDLLVGHIR